MARKESNIYKRKDGRWEARYVKEIGLDGRKKYGSVYGGTYTEAQQKRLEIMRNVRPYVVSSNSSVLSDIMWEWIQSVRNSIKPNTLQKYDSIIRKHIETTVIGKTNLRFLNAKSISDFANQKAESGLSVKTVNDILIVVGLALNYAEEVYQIDVYAVNSGPGSFTGVRIGELCALDWGDITDEIKISKTLYRIKQGNRTVLEIAEPKTPSSNRVIPVPECIRGYVEWFRDYGSVLKNRNGNRVEPRLMQMTFEKFVAECGLPKTNFHALRHTFATRCVEAGFDIKSLSEILGHSDVKTTLNKYVHSSMEQKQKNMALLKSLVG